MGLRADVCGVPVTVLGSVQAETVWLFPTQSLPADLARSSTVFI